MSGWRSYGSLQVLEQDSGYLVCDGTVLLASTDSAAMADKLFFKLALDVASGAVADGERAQVALTAAGKRRLCENKIPPVSGADIPPCLKGGKENGGTVTPSVLPTASHLLTTSPKANVGLREARRASTENKVTNTVIMTTKPTLMEFAACLKPNGCIREDAPWRSLYDGSEVSV